jgi:hypothetical protein
MPIRKSGVAMLFAAACAPVVFIAAPVAVADECDPSVTVCQGPELQTDNSPPAAAPAPAAADDQYPYDDEWYFNPAGGGTELQPNHPSTGGGGGGGGGHR